MLIYKSDKLEKIVDFCIEFFHSIFIEHFKLLKLHEGKNELNTYKNDVSFNSENESHVNFIYSLCYLLRKIFIPQLSSFELKDVKNILAKKKVEY
jgi:hypothetical protein